MVAEELARDTVPFGGFPWGRLAFAETASPFTPYAAVGGAPLVTFATALCGALAAAAVVAAGSWRRAVPLVLLIIADQQLGSTTHRIPFWDGVHPCRDAAAVSCTGCG